MSTCPFFAVHPSNFPRYLVITVLLSFLTLSGCSTSSNPRGPKPKSIRIEQPTPDQTIKSPLTVRGEARGSWYFEGEFTVKLLTADDRRMGTDILTAQSSWMRSDYIQFEGKVTFDNPGRVKRGRLVFESANPSGQPEHQKTTIVPVRFPN